MNVIAKMAGKRYGNGIVRQYRNAKINRNVFAGTTLLDFSIATMDAMDKNATGTIVMGLLTCLILKLSKDSHSTMMKLKPQRNAIIARARQIFEKRK